MSTILHSFLPRINFVQQNFGVDGVLKKLSSQENLGEFFWEPIAIHQRAPNPPEFAQPRLNSSTWHRPSTPKFAPSHRGSTSYTGTNAPELIPSRPFPGLYRHFLFWEGGQGVVKIVGVAQKHCGPWRCNSLHAELSKSGTEKGASTKGSFRWRNL